MSCSRRYRVLGLGQCLVLATLAARVAAPGSEPPARPRLRDFAFASRDQDRRREADRSSPAGCRGDAQRWHEHGAQLIGEGQAGDGLRCLLLAARLGCATAHIYQDMSIARLTQGDLGGALADARRAVLLAGCGERLAARQGKRAEVRRCASPELLLNYASVLDKVDASHTAHPHILQLLRDFVDVACRVDESGTLACTARGAIAGIVELWRLGQLSFGNWDSWRQDEWMLTAAVEADVERCRAQAPGERFSVVQPWEVKNRHCVLHHAHRGRFPDL